MRDKRGLFAEVILAVVAVGLVLLARSAGAHDPKTSPAVLSGDAVADAQTARQVAGEPSSESLADQPQHGSMTGFDFCRDPLGAMKPGTTFEEIYRSGVANNPKDTMSRGKPLPVGPAARFRKGRAGKRLPR